MRPDQDLLELRGPITSVKDLRQIEILGEDIVPFEDLLITKSKQYV